VKDERGEQKRTPHDVVADVDVGGDGDVVVL
jgi:hypothetical protein